MTRNLRQLYTLFLLLLSIKSIASTDDDDIFQYIREPVPEEFTLGQSYPSRNETEECRPIRLRIARNSHQYLTNLVVNSNPQIVYSDSDARVMTSRLQSRLNDLAALYYDEYSLRIIVLHAWVEYSDDDGIGDPYSLHYEGRTVRVQLENADHYSELLKMAVEVGFDWVSYESPDYVRMSVIPDLCDANLDIVFMLDQSGSVGEAHHDIAVQFLQDVVSFYNIGDNATQVGLVTFSTGARVEFPLDEFTDVPSLQAALADIQYRGGWTTTAFALLLAQQMLNPSRGYGARPTSAGVPRIAILLTDGRSNIYPIAEIAPSLRNSGVQVYTVGIGNIYLSELRFIASDPDTQHVFLLSSFDDAPNFVDFLSITACDAPAIVVPGENTTNEVEEDGFRFFQSECPAFSETIMIEQIDLVGTCSLYASTTDPNPGPLSPNGVISNEDHSTNKRTVHLQLPFLHRFIYWSVKGVDLRNLFSVVIWDMIFPEDSYTVFVTEGVTGAQVFDLDAALRLTNVTFNYTIQSGDDDGLFTIEDGVIFTAVPLDSTNTEHSLTIVATNSLHDCHRGRVTIIVIVTRDQIEFPPLQPASIPEDAAVGDPVVQVQVLGGDNTIQYSISSGNVGGAFEIDTLSGAIQVAGPLDFEDISNYSLTVQAVRTSTGSVAMATQVVNIEDVNEPPFFVTTCAVSDDCVFNVSEGAAANTPIATIEAGDPDLPTTLNGQLLFEIVEDVPFVVVQNGRVGEIQTSGLLTENRFSYTFTLRVQDIESSISTSVTVLVDDINNNPPVFVQPPVVLQVLESTDIGTSIVQYIATDADQGVNAEIVFSLASNTLDLPFEIDPATGNLTVSGALDFEGITIYFLTITASNPDGLQMTSIQTVISLVDVNDNPPIFSEEVYAATLEEHSPGGTPVMTVRATDADSGQNADLVFSIVSGNIGDVFSIDMISPGIASITVSLGADIDREVVPLYELTVTATDGGSPQMSDTARVVVTVTDINDNAPEFLPDLFNIELREDTVPPFDVVSVYVFDLDQEGTVNTEVDFEITSGNIGDVFNLEQVDNKTAILQLIGNLSFETQPAYTIELTATDRGTNPGPLSSTAVVQITVQNIDTSPPIVNGNQTIEVPEGIAVGTELAIINATDDGGVLMFTIRSVMGDGVNGETALGFFDINDDGTVTLAQRLDLDMSTSFELTIEVSDGVSVTTAILVVLVINENQFPPSITTLDFSVLEEQSNGTIVGTVEAVDTDAEPSENITFSIQTGRLSSLFNIESETGVLRTSQVLDREALVQGGLFLPENNSSERITILATDGGTPRLSSAAEIVITLLDLNDNTPAFLNANGTAGNVMENSLASIDGIARAQDPDLGASGEVSYSLDVLNLQAGATSPFEISGEGDVSVVMQLDREEQSSYSLLVQATDGGTPQLSSSLLIEIQVLDQNDNAPNFTQSIYTVDILETASTPEVVLQVFAFDADSGPLGELTYSITMADPPITESLFSINNSTGEIILIQGLDFETTPSHTLTVRAEDGGSPPLFATATVEITVENVDEIPPQFVQPCTVRVFEDVSPDNTPILVCIAIDVDDTTPIPTTAEQYELLEGNEDEAFTISNTGTVRVVAPLDRELVDFYSIRVRATDRVGLSTDTLLNITVLDVNDNMPVISNLPLNRPIPVARIQMGQRDVITIEAMDADIGPNGDVTYTITTVDQLPGDQTTNVVIEASDNGSPPMSTSGVLTVVFEEPCTIQQYSINSTSGLVEGHFLCSVEAQPTIANVTIGTNAILRCPILTNIPVEYTWSHNGTAVLGPVSLEGEAGELAIVNATFQDAGEYTCRAQSDIGSLLSTPALVKIQVPPVINIPPESLTVSETGRTISFRCFASGLPSPVITWSRLSPNGTSIPIVDDGRVLPQDNFLIITNLGLADSGTYICTASNPAGEVSASADLVLFSQSNVVIAPLMAFSMPSMQLNCHDFNTSQFQDIMTGITGTTTMVTAVDGDDLCPPTACSPSPCLNGGSCDLLSDDASGREYTCTCPMGYTGTNCETDIDECSTAEPCLSGGTCTNTPGSFTCECASGFTGHRCQYTTVCDTQPCAADQMCVATIANTQGFVCEAQSVDGLTVSLGASGSPGMLDDEVNNLREIQQDSDSDSRRRKRQADDQIDLNGFVTTCEARFVAIDDGRYLLLWACPQGVESPSVDDLDEICDMLFTRGLVSSCETPGGLNRTSIVDPLQPTDVFVHFILVSVSRAPLSGRQAIDLLERTDALERLRAQGYQAVNFTTAVPLEPLSQTVTDRLIIGVVVGVLVAAFTATLIFCVVICVIRNKSSKKTLRTLDNSHTLDTVYPLSHNQQEEHRYISAAYVHMNQEPLEHTFTFGDHPTPVKTPARDEPTFDDAIYSTRYIPPQPVSKSAAVASGNSTEMSSQTAESNGGVTRRGSSLKRSSAIFRGKQPSLKHRTESKDNLLSDEDNSPDYDHLADSGDYDTVENWQEREARLPAVPDRNATKQTSAPARESPAASHDDEVIYGNLQHTKAGAHGNAGQRWESYWQTKTLFRSTKPQENGVQ